MQKIWRVIDTGLRPAAENIAFNRALLEARADNDIPGTLRFLQVTPSALLGFHQSAEQELNLDYCRAEAITVQRRITGGGAIYFDETQLGWELYLHRGDFDGADMAGISKRICEAAARGISTLGVEARFRPRNDIEVNGRKISGTGGAFEGDALMFQGTLLLQFDVEKMLRALRIPAEKLSGKAISSARERVASLADLLGHVPPLAEVKARMTEAFAREFDVAFAAAEVAEPELARYRQALAEIDHPDWVNMLNRPSADAPLVSSLRKFPGGILRADVLLDRAGRRIKQVWFSGDFFVSPRRTVIDLEAALRGISLDRLEQKIGEFFAARNAELLMLSPGDFAAVITAALAEADMKAEG